MKRSFRLLLIVAPLLLLLLGVPAGVALARRAPQELPPLVQPGPSVPSDPWVARNSAAAPTHSSTASAAPGRHCRQVCRTLGR